jgi:hypothetical protein
MADVETIDDTLYCVAIVGGCSRQCEDSEMGVFCGNEPDNLVVRMVSRGVMSLVWETHKETLVFKGGERAYPRLRE